MNREALLKERHELNQELQALMDVVPGPDDDAEHEAQRNQRIARIQARLQEIDRLLSDDPFGP